MTAITVTTRFKDSERDVSWIFPKRVIHGEDERRFRTACVLTSKKYASAIYDTLTKVSLRSFEIMDNCYKIAPEKACKAIKELAAFMNLGDGDFKIETFQL